MYVRAINFLPALNNYPLSQLVRCYINLISTNTITYTWWQCGFVGMHWPPVISCSAREALFDIHCSNVVIDKQQSESKILMDKTGHFRGECYQAKKQSVILSVTNAIHFHVQVWKASYWQNKGYEETFWRKEFKNPRNEKLSKISLQETEWRNSCTI